jgi:hypothetical protein
MADSKLSFITYESSTSVSYSGVASGRIKRWK